MILGLDVSTSCIGWTILSDDGKFVNIGKIQVSEEKDFYTKCDLFRSFLRSLPGGDYKVFVEEPLKMFKANASMAQTIALLQRFNAVCCYSVYCELGVRPHLVMESSARKLANIKVPKENKGKAKKLFVLKHLQGLGIIPASVWEYKRTGTPKDFCFDMADSWVIATAGLTVVNGLR